MGRGGVLAVALVVAGCFSDSGGGSGTGSAGTSSGSSGTASGSTTGTTTTTTTGAPGCVPGLQVECPCLEAPPGIQICLPDNTFGPCSCDEVCADTQADCVTCLGCSPVTDCIDPLEACDALQQGCPQMFDCLFDCALFAGPDGTTGIGTDTMSGGGTGIDTCIEMCRPQADNDTAATAALALFSCVGDACVIACDS